MLDLVNIHAKGLGGAVFVGANPLEILSGGQEGRLCVRDEAANETQEVKRVENSAINCIAGHPKQTHYAIADQSKGVFVSRQLLLSPFRPPPIPPPFLPPRYPLSSAPSPHLPLTYQLGHQQWQDLQ